MSPLKTSFFEVTATAKPKRGFMYPISELVKKTWRLKYRFYTLIILILITPVFGASGANAREQVSPNVGFEIVAQNMLISQIERDQNYKTAFATIGQPEQIFVSGNFVYLYDRFGNLVSSGSLSEGFASQYLSQIPVVEFQERPQKVEVEVINKDFIPQTDNTDQELNPDEQEITSPNNQAKPRPDNSLQKVVPKPAQPIRTNWISYPKYKIQVPLIYTNYSDLYNKNPDGSINFASPIDQGPVDSPVQIKLKDGVVHLAYSPLPGEVGNSYIVGHSSNFSSVKSAYNRVFKPIESVSRPGEEFFVYDQEGRELKFCVFDALKIAEEDVKEAFKSFGQRRVVTLQTSILGVKNGKVAATHRWLTRGELCN